MFVSILLEIERNLQKSLLFGILPILSFRVSFYRTVMIRCPVRPTVHYSKSFESIMYIQWGLPHLWCSNMKIVLQMMSKVLWTMARDQWMFVSSITFLSAKKEQRNKGLGLCSLTTLSINNTLVISWRLVLLVEETGVLGENHQPAASHWQTFTHNVASSTPHLSGIQTHTVGGDRHWLHM